MTCAPDGVLDALVPAARAITVMLYGFAAFAKLNHDFVDVSVSCAAQFYGHITTWWPPLPDGPEIRRARNGGRPPGGRSIDL